MSPTKSWKSLSHCSTGVDVIERGDTHHSIDTRQHELAELVEDARDARKESLLRARGVALCVRRKEVRRER
jgi:hypothetical protein